MITPQIHWHEGLFLQPHHLQRMQKGLSDMVGAERRLLWAYPEGVIEARPSYDELANLRVRFDKLKVVMPSGLVLSYPENAELPSLDIKQAFSQGAGSFVVYLGVPLWQESRANILPRDGSVDSRAKLMYRVVEQDCADENTGKNLRPVDLRMINAQLMLQHEDRSDLEVVPLLRIGRGTGEDAGLPRPDREYVPPCFVLDGSPALRDLVRDLVNQIEANRKELAVQVTRGGISMDTLRGVQLEQIWRLRSLNRASAKLPALVQKADCVPPFLIYLELRELLGELAALRPERDGFESAPYNHEDLYACFTELDGKIRALLKGVGGGGVINVPFKGADGIPTAQLEERHFTEPNAYLLAIKTSLDPTALVRYVTDPDKFKMMPKSLSRTLVRGVELREERVPPQNLPTPANMYYFRVVTAGDSERIWKRIAQERIMCLVWRQAEMALQDSTFTLYMTVPLSGAKP